MKTENQPTPETDTAERLYADRQHHYAVRDLARKLERERDEARELARELRDALEPTLSRLVGRMTIPDTDTVEQAHVALTKAKEVLP